MDCFRTAFTNEMNFDLTKGTPDKVTGLLGDTWTIDLYEDKNGNMVGRGTNNGYQVAMNVSLDKHRMITTYTVVKDGKGRQMVTVALPAEGTVALKLFG